MNKHQENKLRVSLSESLENWWEALEADLPWIGQDVLEYMADAALAVLLGIANTQDYLEEEGRMAQDAP